MGGWQVALARQAVRDLDAITRFIAEESPAAAQMVRGELVDMILTLNRFPQRGRVVTARPSFRKLTHRHYLVIYKLEERDQRVVVIRVWDGRRDPAKLRLPRQ